MRISVFVGATIDGFIAREDGGLDFLTTFEAEHGYEEYMRTVDAIYPAYGFSSHVGYITPGHSRIVRERGPSEIHRRSFQALCYRSEDELELAAVEA